MAKGLTFVVLYSIVLLALFCIFCYLMTTVNPAPINSEVAENSTEIEDFLPSLRDGIISYGLEKYHSIKKDDDDDEQQIVSTDPTDVILLERKSTRDSEPISTSSDHLDLKTLTSKTTDEIDNPLDVTMGIKKGKRRSINENLNSKLEQTGAVILKIVDATGNTKIEIKVEPDAFNANDIKDISYYKNYKNKREYKNKDTVIKVLPNNTLSLAKSDSAVVIDFAIPNTIVSKKVTKTKADWNTRSYITLPSIILRTLKNNKLVLFSATNSTEKYVTKSQQSSR